MRVITDVSEVPRDRKVVIDFFATWCGPCKQIAPYYEDLAATFPAIEFVKADVDTFGDDDGEFDVQMLPTFVLLNKGVVHSTVKGADITKLMKLVGELEAA
jgi:thioredoxin 1